MFAGRRPRLSGFDKYLASGEKVLFSCRQHVVLLVKPMAIWVAAILIGSLVGFALSPSTSEGFVDRLAGFVVLGATAYSALKIARWWWARYVVTDQRVLFVEGIIARKVSAVPLEKVTETTFSRSMWGRLIGYGDLLLDSPGERPGLDTLFHLPKPDEVYRLVTSLVVQRAWEQPKKPDPYPWPRSPDEEDTGPIPRVI